MEKGFVRHKQQKQLDRGDAWLSYFARQLSLGSSHRYYLYRDPTDMRKGFNGLSGLVQSELGHDPLSGDVFIFINRRRDKIKFLVWDRSGFVIWYKRLESGTFEMPSSSAQNSRISWQELVLILEGVELKSGEIIAEKDQEIAQLAAENAQLREELAWIKR